MRPGVAHEINNPLTGILTFVEGMLEDTPTDDPRRDELSFIMHETLRCRQIVRDLLEFSRHSKTNRQPTALQPIVHRAVNLVRKQHSFREIRFELDVASCLTRVLVDANQVQQLLLNLILNVRDAMDGKGRIAIRTFESVGAGRRVVLEVADEGCGIGQDLLEQVFEPFFSTKGEAGNGLGLAAVRTIVEDNNGAIEVNSEVDRGTVFRIECVAHSKDSPHPGGTTPPTQCPA